LVYTLLGRIGAGRTGYIGVMVPVIALIVSALFEGFQWQLATWLGAGRQCHRHVAADQPA
jgi:drug/metabolite transporter (DMT)-like permease